MKALGALFPWDPENQFAFNKGIFRSGLFCLEKAYKHLGPKQIDCYWRSAVNAVTERTRIILDTKLEMYVDVPALSVRYSYLSFSVPNIEAKYSAIFMMLVEFLRWHRSQSKMPCLFVLLQAVTNAAAAADLQGFSLWLPFLDREAATKQTLSRRYHEMDDLDYQRTNKVVPFRK